MTSKLKQDKLSNPPIVSSLYKVKDLKTNKNKIETETTSRL